MWARIEENLVMEVTNINPKGRFHPDLIWKKCQDGVTCGWVYEDGVFKEPVVVSDETVEE